MLVSFEGLDGSGKSTQVELLRQQLAKAGRDVVATREPGGTELGEGLRELLLNGPEISPWAEAALFAAARAELEHQEMTGVTARLERSPLRRRLLLSGPADDFQQRELVRIMDQIPGVSGVRWISPPSLAGEPVQ